eukprot:53422-Prymnesium_polylepis.2
MPTPTKEGSPYKALPAKEKKTKKKKKEAKEATSSPLKSPKKEQEKMVAAEEGLALVEEASLARPSEKAKRRSSRGSRREEVEPTQSVPQYRRLGIMVLIAVIVAGLGFFSDSPATEHKSRA